MALPSAPVTLDGSHGEGGGALARTALTLSALTQQPVHLSNVRGKMRSPGLNSEDLAVVKTLGLCCDAEVRGAHPGSTELRFVPMRRIHALNERIGIPESLDGPGSANALVILQSLAPLLCRTGAYCTLAAEGETFGNNILGFDAFASVTAAAWRRMGLYVFPELRLAAYGRGSRGEVVMDVEPSSLTGLDWQVRGGLVGLRAIVTTSELPEAVGQRGIAHLERLAAHAEMPLETEQVMVRAKGPGANVTVWAEYEGGLGSASALGAKGVRIEQVAQSAYDQCAQWMASGASVDAFLADQLLLPACLADGETHYSTPNLTERLATMVWVVKQFLPIHLTVRGSVGGPATVSVRR